MKLQVRLPRVPAKRRYSLRAGLEVVPVRLELLADVVALRLDAFGVCRADAERLADLVVDADCHRALQVRQVGGLAGAEILVAVVVRDRRRPQVMADQRHQFFAFLAAEEIFQRVQIDVGMIEALEIGRHAADQRRGIHDAFGEGILRGAHGVEPGRDGIIGKTCLSKRVHQLEQVAAQFHVVAQPVVPARVQHLFRHRPQLVAHRAAPEYRKAAQDAAKWQNQISELHSPVPGPAGGGHACLLESLRETRRPVTAFRVAVFGGVGAGLWPYRARRAVGRTAAVHGPPLAVAGRDLGAAPSLFPVAATGLPRVRPVRGVPDRARHRSAAVVHRRRLVARRVAHAAVDGRPGADRGRHPAGGRAGRSPRTSAGRAVCSMDC